MKLLFIVNPGSGNNTTNWKETIELYFSDKEATIDILVMEGECLADTIIARIKLFKPERMVAVGGDGTIKLVTTCLAGLDIPLAVVPAGSANGMAKELGIPEDTEKSLDLVAKGVVKKIHLVKVNDELCIHLADIGFNAFMIKKFESTSGRGMWGYIKASWKVLWKHPHMWVHIQVDGKEIKRSAAMIVIANATRYGSGALINPNGNLEDELFELIIIKKISFKEIYKMMITHSTYDPAKTEVFHTSYLKMKSKVKAHFQVDGEYLGKINHIEAVLLPAAIGIIVPG